MVRESDGTVDFGHKSARCRLSNQFINITDYFVDITVYLIIAEQFNDIIHLM